MERPTEAIERCKHSTFVDCKDVAEYVFWLEGQRTQWQRSNATLVKERDAARDAAAKFEEDLFYMPYELDGSAVTDDHLWWNDVDEEWRAWGFQNEQEKGTVYMVKRRRTPDPVEQLTRELLVIAAVPKDNRGFAQAIYDLGYRKQENSND